MSSNSSVTSFHATVMVVVAAATAAAYYHVKKPSTAITTVSSRSMDGSTTTDKEEENRLSFWNNRWTAGNTGWHLPEVNASLKKHSDLLFETIVGGGARVLVPLCGKTVDMEFLVQKRVVGQVVGVDGIAQALTEYAAEHPDMEITPGESTNGYGTWKGIKTTLLHGDFFSLDAKTAGGTFDAAWDRGSLVAIQPNLREAYVEKMGELMTKPNGRILLSTIVRVSGDLTTGPPFSIDEKEVRRLYEGKDWVASIELLEKYDGSQGFSWYKAMTYYMKMGKSENNIFLITTK